MGTPFNKIKDIYGTSTILQENDIVQIYSHPSLFAITYDPKLIYLCPVCNLSLFTKQDIRNDATGSSLHTTRCYTCKRKFVINRYLFDLRFLIHRTIKI